MQVRYIYTIISAAILSLAFTACSKTISNKALKSPMKDSRLLERHELTEDYLQELEEWRENRVKALSAPEGWLSLIGLHWLKEGENRIGSGKENDIILPDMMEKHIANIHLDNGSLKFTAYGESFLGTGGDQADADGTIRHDKEDNTTILRAGSLVMFVIKRADRYGLRIKNTLAESRYKLDSIPNFAANADLIRTAKVIPVTNQKQNVGSIIGAELEYEVNAYLQFIHNGKAYQITAFDGGPDYFYIVLKDETAGESTYGAGRFVDVKRPEPGDSYVLLDFNKTYNPPCAFTDFATCPLPPQENFLPFSLLAGEKRIKNH